MKLLARWAWVAVLGTALTLSWWSLDALARHYGMPAVLAGMVSATFDGSALVAAELAIRRAQAADSAATVKLLMLGTVGLSAWLNYEHGALLHYPLAVRVLFASPPVIAGSLFELQLRCMHRVRLRELGRIAEPLPRMGILVWAMHPIATMRRLSQITASRLRSVPLDVMDWTGAPVVGHRPTAVVERRRAVQSVRTGSVSGAAQAPAGALAVSGPVHPGRPVPRGAVNGARPAEQADAPARRGPRLSDEHYAAKLREAVAAAGGVIPSARQVARLLSVGQDRSRRLVAQLRAEQSAADGWPGMQSDKVRPIG